jgi:hypothetical protein
MEGALLSTWLWFTNGEPKQTMYVALNSSEFFERQGTSLGGSFVEAGRLPEAWSAEIVRTLLAPDHKFAKRLI